MKKRIAMLCAAIVAFSMAFTFFMSGNAFVETNVSTAVAEVYNAENEESTTSSVGNIVSDAVSGIGSGAGDLLGEVVSNFGGGIGSGDSGAGELLGGLGDSLGGGLGSGLGSGIGDAFGGIADSIGGIFGGLGGGTTAVTYSNTYIDPVPAATQDYNIIPQQPQTQVVIQQVPAPETTHGATVDYALTANPYAKPEGDLVAGDEGEGVKWLQWIFIYTRYGLRDDGITGVMDEDTVAVVKKLQQEKGLTIDGNVNADVISAAEVLYYEYSFGVQESASDVANVSVPETSQQADNSGKNNSAAALIAIAVAVIWIVAIVLILVLFIIKKKKGGKPKKKKADKPADTSEVKTENVKSEAAKAEEPEAEGDKSTEFMSLSDLFEEANNK